MKGIEGLEKIRQILATLRSEVYIKSDASLWMVKSSGAPQKALEDMKLPE